ncbi:tyrosine-type recombinase/integrase [Acinetobacter sp. CFCC 10889]|uniref:tyrosine-type recombinase/integrase n=1 Tax=Acinetobacter sp. CFCC 10889 TaxID=1775557 RepID=UPI000DD01FF9|nr:site-specific integrase [Acinetobacter sp. CFCC 10889]
MPLTDTWLKKNLGKERADLHIETDQDGLSVRVTPKGKITFQMRYRYAGKQVRLDLGSYPNISLKDARAELQKMKAVLETGYDPRVHKKIEIHKITEAVTFEELFRDWYKKYVMQNKKSHHQILRSFELYVFPKVGSLPCDQITLHHWLDLLEAHVEGSESITDRILANTKQCLNWGINRKLIELNPIRHISGKLDLNIKKNRTVRVLSDDEVSLILGVSDHSKTSLKNVLFFKLCLFYGNRYSELRIALKSHFDFKNNTWTVPPENHKTGEESKRSIVRPIIEEIKPWLQAAMDLSNSDYIFPNAKSNEPMGRSGPTDMPYNFMQYARRRMGIEMKHWSFHDLRRTARTNFSAFTSRDIAELMVGHVMPGEQATYDYYDYQEEMAKAYKKWWDKLESLTN